MVSGSADVERPAFNRLRADIEAGSLDVVITKSVDRLSLNLRRFVQFADECQKRGTSIHVVESGIDTSTATGMLMLNLLGTFAAFESDQIALRQTVSQAHRRKEGRATGSPPLGSINVKRDGGTYRQIDPITAPVIETIAASLIDGASISATAKQLNEQGLLPRTGNLWKPWSLRVIATNPGIAGLRKHKDGIERDDAGIPIVDSHLAIISLEDWFELQDKIAGCAKSRPQGLRDSQTLLQGLAVCNGCHKPLIRKSTGGRKRYGCAQRTDGACPDPVIIEANTLDDFIIAQIEPLLDLPAITMTVESDPVAVQKKLLRSAEMENLANTIIALQPSDMLAAAERLGQLKTDRDNIDIAEVLIRTDSGETLRDWWAQDKRKVLLNAIEQISVSRGRDVAKRTQVQWRDSEKEYEVLFRPKEPTPETGRVFKSQGVHGNEEALLALPHSRIRKLRTLERITSGVRH